MKLRKSIMACVVAAAVVVSSAVCVMAGSITKNATAEGYKVEAVTAQTAVYTQVKADEPVIADAVVAVNDGKMTMKEFIAEVEKQADQIEDAAAKESLTKIAEQLAGKEFVSGFYSLTEEDSAKVEKTEDGKYKVTLTVENLTKDLTGLKVLAYNTTTKEWEIVEIPAENIDVANHTITITLEDISLFSIISDETPAK